MKLRKNNAFTLIEMLLAIVIFAIVSTSLYLSMRTGLRLYGRIGQNLNEAHEITYFLDSLDHELKNSFFLSSHPFIGKHTTLEFPSVVKTYTRDSEQTELVLLRYSIKSDHIKKNSKYLSSRKSSLKDTAILKPYLEKMEFEYAFYDEDDASIEWDRSWDSEEFGALPRAIKIDFTITFSSDASEVNKTREFEKIIFIPDGVWGSVDV